MRLFVFLAIAPLAAASINPQQFSLHLADGNPGDRANVLAADPSGNLYVVSTTQISPPDATVIVSPTVNIRVTKTDSSGNVLASFTFFGSGQDTPYAAAIDPQGNLVIGGSTNSTDFPLVAPLRSTGSGFVAKVNPQLTQIVYSTLFGAAGNGGTQVAALTLDAKGNIYLAGTTPAGFITTPGALQTASNPGVTTAFVAEISAAGNQLIFSTAYGGSNFVFNGPPDFFSAPVAYTSPSAIALDASGNVIVAGTTDTTDLMVTSSAWVQQCGCTWENGGGFVAKIGSAGTQLIWGTYTPTYLFVSSIALDTTGDVVLAGNTDSKFPVTSSALQPTTIGSLPVGFVAELNANGSGLNFGTFFGAGFGPGVATVAIDSQGTIWLTGGSATAALPAKAGTALVGNEYIAGISADGSGLLSLATFPAGSVGVGFTIRPQGNIAALGPTGWLLISSSTPRPRLAGIVEDGASQVSRAVCGREVISLYGVNIGPATAQTEQVANGAISNSLGGVQVLFNGVAAALLYAGPTQINLIVPSGVTLEQTTTLQITSPNGTISVSPVPVQQTIPQVFVGSNGYAFAVNQDGTINSNSNPAAPGSIVAIWMTGGGAASPGATDNTINTNVSQGQFLTSVYSTANGYQALEVDYDGDAPGQPSGIIQVNFRVPENANGAFNGYAVQIGSGVSGFYIAVQ